MWENVVLRLALIFLVAKYVKSGKIDDDCNVNKCALQEDAKYALTDRPSRFSGEGGSLQTVCFCQSFTTAYL